MSVISFRHLHNVSTIGSGSVKFKVYAPYQLPQLATPQNVSASGTTVSWDAVANAESYDVYVDNTLYENTTGSVTHTGETWLLNSILNGTLAEQSINFTSNNQSFVGIVASGNNPMAYSVKYKSSDGDIEVFQPRLGWVAGEEYRTITFETAPTGDLLTWLQANATKQ